MATLAIAGSRITGLVREIVFAFLFGAGPALDAFIAAFRIPNLLRDLFAEGALSTSFVSIFSQKLESHGRQEAFHLASRVFTFVLITIGIISLFGILFSDSIVAMVASGFAGEKLALAVTLNRLLFPFILFISLAAVSMGMLNTLGKFALPQSASTFFNLTSIVSGIAFAYLLSPEFVSAPFRALAGGNYSAASSDWTAVSRAITGMAIGTLLGGLIQWLVQTPSLWRQGYRPRFNIGFRDSSFLSVLKLTGPAIIGGAAVQVNVLVNTNFASYLADGSISWLNFAFRLMQFPIGLFGVAVALASAPALSRIVVQNDRPLFCKTMQDAIKMALFLCIPSALGLIALAEPIIALIYQHGHFSPSDTLETANALRAYAIGLSFYALLKIYQPAFLAHHDAKTPMMISLLSIAINLVGNWFFVFKLGFAYWGLALGTSSVALWDLLLLSLLFRKKSRGIWTTGVFLEILKITVCAVIAVAVGWVFFRWLGDSVEAVSLGIRLLMALTPIGLTAVLFLASCRWLKVGEASLFWQSIRKRVSPKQQEKLY